jgi:DNA-binding NarL/FixJ family response regulator
LSHKITILIVDDHAVVRAGIKSLLCDQPDMQVTGEAASVAQARTLLGTGTFDVLVLDLTLSGETGWELLELAKRKQPPVAVLVLSAYREDQYAIQALKNGADGYLNKESAPEFLLAAIRRVASGHKYVSPELAEKLARSLGGTANATHEGLSAREFAILRCIARGQTLVAIAEAFHVSPKTITTHRSRILDKLGLANNAELTRYALEKGLLDKH